MRGPYETALEHGELVEAIEVPAMPPDGAMAHLRFAVHERPAATVSAWVRVADGRVADARVAAGSVGIVPVAPAEATAALAGQSASAIDSGRPRGMGRALADASAPVTTGTAPTSTSTRSSSSWRGERSARLRPGRSPERRRTPPPDPSQGPRRCGSSVCSLTVGAIALVVSANVPPLRVECPTDDMSVEVCHDSVTASLDRGLPVPHPLILAVRVEAGPVHEGAYGHRATVSYDLLGVPSPTTVRLYYDIGGHWGGQVDRGTFELAAWWGVPIVVLLLVGGLLVTRRHHQP